MKLTSNRKTRNLLIYPKFQLALLGMQSVVLLAVFGLIMLQVHRSYEHLNALGGQAGLDADHAYFKFVVLQSKTIYTNLGIGLVVAYTLSAAFTLFLSHRLAGPIVRLRGYFRDMAAAEFPQAKELKFRDGDFFSDLPDHVNRGLKNLERVSEEKRKAG